MSQILGRATRTAVECPNSRVEQTRSEILAERLSLGAAACCCREGVALCVICVEVEVGYWVRINYSLLLSFSAAVCSC